MSEQFLPLLKPQNIDELKSLILEIMEDNDQKLEKIIESRQNQSADAGVEFSIGDLNDLLSEQCLQKQKIVSNLSHFALSLMNTIEVLWQDNQDLEYRVRDQRDVMEQMNNHMHEISKQSEFLKNKLHNVYSDLHKIQEEKQAIEQYLSSMIVKHDGSFCLNQNTKHAENTSYQKTSQSPNIHHILLNESYPQHSIQQVQLHNNPQQISITQSQSQHREINHEDQMNLLEESLIKDSISVLRRFTLQDSVQQRLATLEESQQNPSSIHKSHKFSLINQISLQISQQAEKPKTAQKASSQKYDFSESSHQTSTIRDLKISNEKINITVNTGTQFTRTRDSWKNRYQQFSMMIQPTSSCTSFLLQRQNSAIMNPSLERSSSTISFVTHTTKHIQTDPPVLKDAKKKDIKNVQRKNIGVGVFALTDRTTGDKKQAQKGSEFREQKNELNQSLSQKSEQNRSRKSFSQLLDYFTKKIVSDRIKTTNKKNEMGGFKKTKSSFQKVF